MVRRSIATVLILAYLAFQLAAVPHAHEAIVAADHGATHVHVSWLAGECSDSGHGHQGHSHEHAGHSHTPDRPAEPEHDSDAVYFSNDPVVVGKTLNAINHLTFCPIAIVPTPLRSESAVCSSDAIFAENCRTHCPLYLELRALRI
jgi:hypothetical protein